MTYKIKKFPTKILRRFLFYFFFFFNFDEKSKIEIRTILYSFIIIFIHMNTFLQVFVCFLFNLVYFFILNMFKIKIKYKSNKG